MNPVANVALLVVDVCGTLFFEDTTIGLLRHHFGKTKSRPLRHILFNLMTARYSPMRLCLVVIEKLTSKHLLKHIVVGLLAGDRVEGLETSAIDYAEWLLNHGRIGSVWSVLNEEVQACQVILASSSLEPIVAALAKSLGASYVSSTLDEKDGVLTGCYGRDLTGCKEQALVAKFGPSILQKPMCVISDNLSDRSLLERASHAYVVLRREHYRHRWQGLKATFLTTN